MIAAVGLASRPSCSRVATIGSTTVFRLPHAAPHVCDSGTTQGITNDSFDSTTFWIGSKYGRGQAVFFANLEDYVRLLQGLRAKVFLVLEVPGSKRFNPTEMVTRSVTGFLVDPDFDQAGAHRRHSSQLCDCRC